MKKVASFVFAFSIVVLLTTDALAQPRPGDRPADRPTVDRSAADRPATAPATTREMWKNTEGLYETGKIIGTRVKGADGKDIGEIDQLLIDPKDGKVTHAVIGVGGLAGIGERHAVVPWSEVKLSTDSRNPNRMVVTMDRTALDKAPRYDKRQVTGDRAPAASPPTSGDVKRNTDKK